MSSSLILGCSRCPRLIDWRANPDVETTDWRARRGKTAHRVRREGTAISVSYPYPATRSRRSGGIYDSPFHDRHQSMAHDASTGRPAKPVGRNFPPGCQSTPFALVWSGLPLSAPLNRQCHIFVAALSSVLVTRGAGKVAYSTAGESFANLAGVPEPRKWEISTLPAKPSQPSHQANAV